MATPKLFPVFAAVAVVAVSLGALGLFRAAGSKQGRDISEASPPRVRILAGRSDERSAPPSAPELRGGEFGFAAYGDAAPWVPDCALAVGPNHLVVPVNRHARFFTKLGTMTYDAPLYGTGGFFSIASDTTVVFDPVALFDPHSQRFFVAAGGRGPDRLYLAVSDDDDPNGAWFQYDFDSSVIGEQTDFPCIGVDSSTVYVSVKMEGAVIADRWKGVVMWEKASILNGGTALVTRRRFSAIFNSISFAGITTYDGGAPAQYFASNPDGPFPGGSAIRLTALRDPQGDRTFDTFDLAISPWWFAGNVDELGNATGISSEPGHFFKHGVYRNGKLYVANNVAPTPAADRAVVRWMEIAMNGWPASGQNPSLVREGSLDLGMTPQGSPISTIYPDIAVDALGNVAIACNRVSADEHASVVRAYRRFDAPANSWTNIAVWKTGSAPGDGFAGGAWGDYSSLDEDPAAPGTFWGHAEFREPGLVRTWIAQLDPTGTSAPVVSAGGASVALGAPRPNPFLDETRVEVLLHRPGPARLEVVDVSGRVVRTLFDTEQAAGTTQASWNGRDDRGRNVVGGVYFVRLVTEGSRVSKKVTLVR